MRKEGEGSRNMYKAPVDEDSRAGGRLNVGGEGWVGQGRVTGEKWGNCN